MIHLNQTHPNLFFVVVVSGIWGTLIGLNIILTKTQLPLGHFKYIIAGAYIVFGLCKLYGAFRSMHLARFGMVGCTFLSIGFSLLSVVAYFSHDIHSFYNAINFFFVGLIQFAALSEPTINPLSARIKQ